MLSPSGTEGRPGYFLESCLCQGPGSPLPHVLLSSLTNEGTLGLMCMHLSGPGLILGAPSVSSSPETCGTSFSEDLNPEEETQTSWDKDIPAINQGEVTVSSCGVEGL